MASFAWLANSRAVSSPFLTRAASATPSCCAHSFQLSGKVMRFHSFRVVEPTLVLRHRKSINTDFQADDHIDDLFKDADGHLRGMTTFAMSATANTHAGTFRIESHDGDQHVFLNINGGAVDMETSLTATTS